MGKWRRDSADLHPLRLVKAAAGSHFQGTRGAACVR